MAAATVLNKDETYIGAGNHVSYFEGATPVRRMVVSTGDVASDFVEVVYYLNPNNGEKAGFPMTIGRDGEQALRTFELVRKTDIFAVNDQPVVIR